MPIAISTIDWSAFGMIVSFIGGGSFALIGAVKKWNWFLQFSSAETLLGRSAARCIYGALGIILIAIGVSAAVARFTDVFSPK